MNIIKEILMDRDGISGEEADNLINAAKERLENFLHGDLESADNGKEELCLQSDTIMVEVMDSTGLYVKKSFEVEFDVEVLGICDMYPDGYTNIEVYKINGDCSWKYKPKCRRLVDDIKAVIFRNIVKNIRANRR